MFHFRYAIHISCTFLSLSVHMGKLKLAKIPLFGYFYKKNSVIVDRAKQKIAYSAFYKGRRKIRKGLNDVFSLKEGFLRKMYS